MDYHINESEIKLLAFLHEHAEGYGDDFTLDPDAVMKGLDMDARTFQLAASYLQELGLAGLRATRVDDNSGSQVFIFGVCLTGAGENFMRNLERTPGIAERVTVAVVSQAYKVGTDVFAKTVAQLAVEAAKARGMVP